MDRYCTILLNPEKHSDIIAACIQASATIKVGNIQAKQIFFAGLMTLFAGVFALGGGFLAYKASTREFIERKKDRILTRNLYRNYISTQTDSAIGEISGLLNSAKVNPIATLKGNVKSSSMTRTDQLRITLSSSNWEKLLIAGEPSTNYDDISLELSLLIVMWKQMMQTFNKVEPTSSNASYITYLENEVIPLTEKLLGVLYRLSSELRTNFSESNTSMIKKLLQKFTCQ